MMRERAERSVLASPRDGARADTGGRRMHSVGKPAMISRIAGCCAVTLAVTSCLGDGPKLQALDGGAGMHDASTAAGGSAPTGGAANNGASGGSLATGGAP